MLAISEILSGIKVINILSKVSNRLTVSSHQNGLDTMVIFRNDGYFSLKDIKIIIEEPEKYYWDNTDSPTIEITELHSGEKQTYILCSHLLQKSKAIIKILFKGIFLLSGSCDVEINVASMIDQ